MSWRLLAALGLAALLVGGVDLVSWPAGDETPYAATSSPGPEGPAAPTAASSPTTPPATEPTAGPATAQPSEAPPVLALSGDFPADGPGTFTFADAAGEVLGESGLLRRFRVAVEDTIDERPAAVARFVDDTLGHSRGWTAGGEVRFQRVPADAAHDFTIYLATGGTAAAMCSAVGVDIRVAGVPYTSCRGPGRVILNLNRWRLSVPEFVEAEVPLKTYRRMVLNHEIGHELGYGHERCPGAGQPAPVMQQQTLFLDGCEAHPWPYRDGRRYAGPPS